MFEPLESRKLFSTVAVAPISVTEPTSGSAAATFTATLRSASTGDVVVTYATADKTARAGSDYTATSGTVNIPAGDTSATFAVPVLADDVSEARETFVVHLKVSAGNRINATAVATIVDPNPSPTVTVEDATVAEPAAGKRSTASVTVDLANPSSRNVTVYVHTVNGTATAGADYVSAARKVVIKAGQTSATTTFKIIGDAAITSDETFDVEIVRAVNGTVDPTDAFGTVTLLGTEDALTDTVSVAPTSVTEGNGGTMTFTITLSAAQTAAVTVDYATSDGTATAGVDYVATSGTLTFAAGQTTGTVAVTVEGDTAVESDETLVLTLSNPTNAVLGTATAIGTILDDDTTTPTTTPTVSVSAASVTASSSATTTLSFPVTLSSAATSAVTVAYATSDGTAVAGTDYVATSGTLTIAAGATMGSVTVTVDAETATAATTKTLTLTLSTATNATLATASAIGTISILATATGTSTTDVSDNLSATTDSTESASGTGLLAASFTTGASAAAVTRVTIPLSVTAGGAVTVAIYTDGGLEPGTLVGTLTSPASYSTTVADTTFTGSVSLSASTTYSVVVTATAGTAHWAWTDSTTGTGSGFTGEWASTSDGGTTWFSDDNYPLQMQVLTT